MNTTPSPEHVAAAEAWLDSDGAVGPRQVADLAALLSATAHAARAEAIEDCARVCDGCADDVEIAPPERDMAEHLAVQIRALAPKDQP